MKAGRGNASRPATVAAVLFTCFASANGVAQTRSWAASSPTDSYIIQPGDSLYGIAARYLLKPDDWAAVARLNHIAAPRLLRSGRKLRLPVAPLKPGAARLNQASDSSLRQPRRPDDRTSRSPVVPPKWTALTVKVLTVNGPVSYAHLDANFIPLTAGTKLVEGDRIKTGENGSARLEFTPDQSHLTVSPNISLKVTTLRQNDTTGAIDRVLNLQKGEVEIEVTPAIKQYDRFQVRTSSVTAGVRGTHFKVRATSDGATDIEVLKGAVAVDSASKPAPAQGVPLAAATQLVTALHGNMTRANGVVGVPHALLSRPELIGQPQIQEGQDVYFDIKPVKDARGYRVRIGRDADLLDQIRDASTGSTHVVVGPLPDGNYFVRVTAIDADGLESVPGTYAFERRNADESILMPVATTAGAP